MGNYTTITFDTFLRVTVPRKPVPFHQRNHCETCNKNRNTDHKFCFTCGNKNARILGSKLEQVLPQYISWFLDEKGMEDVFIVNQMHFNQETAREEIYYIASNSTDVETGFDIVSGNYDKSGGFGFKEVRKITESNTLLKNFKNFYADELKVLLAWLDEYNIKYEWVYGVLTHTEW